MLRFSGSGVSDIGLVRAGNEDAAFVAPYVALVADGVGGAAAGEVASATAAYVVAATALSRFGSPPAEVVRDAVASARSALLSGVRERPEREGMATTLTCVVTDGAQVALGHLGDSRAYLLRDGMLTRLSRDHTYVQHLVDLGELLPEDVASHPWRNVVLRSLDSVEHEAGEEDEAGVSDALVTDLEADVTLLEVRPGDRLLLCSDGLSDLVADEDVRRGLLVQDPASAAAVLTSWALEAGGRDNVTCVVIDVVEGPLVVGDGLVLGALRDVVNIVDPGSVHL